MSVGVLFEIGVTETLPGETLCIVGDRPELGAWEAQAATETASLRLSTSSLVYPRWLARGPIWLDVGAPEIVGQEFSFEFKFVKASSHDHRIHWEDNLPANRRVTLPCEDGCIWIVSVAKWNSSAEALNVTKATNDELRSWHMGLDIVRCSADAANKVYSPKAAKPNFKCGKPSSFDTSEYELDTPRTAARQRVWQIEEQYKALDPDRAQTLSTCWAENRETTTLPEGPELTIEIPKGEAPIEPQRPRSSRAKSLAGISTRKQSVTRRSSTSATKSAVDPSRPRRRGRTNSPAFIAASNGAEECVVDKLQSENAKLRDELQKLKAAMLGGYRRTSPPGFRPSMPFGASPHRGLPTAAIAHLPSERGLAEGAKLELEEMGPMSGEEADADRSDEAE